MSYDWTTTAVAIHDRIDDPDIWNQHLAACQERAVLLDPNLIIGAGDPYLGAVSTVSAGTNIQTCLWWSGRTIAGNPIPTPEYVGMQAFLTGAVGAFIDRTITFEGLTTVISGLPNYANMDFATARTNAGLPVCYQLPPAINADGSSYGYTTPNLATLPANSSWRRCRPREVFYSPYPFFTDYTYSDNYDLESNPAAIGQHAFRIDVNSNTALHTCTATGTHGTWMRENVCPPNMPPIVDMLDNTLDSPNCITLDFWSGWYFGSFAINATTYGTMVYYGDYLGHWLFDEVRAITNECRWMFAQIIGGDSNPHTGFGSSTISYADALANMNASWTYNPYLGVPGSGRGSGAYISAAYDDGVATGTAPTWYAFGQRWEKSDYLGYYEPLPAAVKDIDLYYFATTAVDGTWVFGAPVVDIFDTQGDTVINGQYHEQWTTGPTTDTYIALPTFGDAATPPPNAPPDPATYGNARQGYETVDSIAVMRFDVPGGFTYVY